MQKETNCVYPSAATSKRTTKFNLKTRVKTSTTANTLFFLFSFVKRALLLVLLPVSDQSVTHRAEHFSVSVVFWMCLLWNTKHVSLWAKEYLWSKSFNFLSSPKVISYFHCTLFLLSTKNIPAVHWAGKWSWINKMKSNTKVLFD